MRICSGFKFHGEIIHHTHTKDTASQSTIIPPKRVRYLAEIAEANAVYDNWVREQSEIASQYYQLSGAKKLLPDAEKYIGETEKYILKKITAENLELINNWPSVLERYKKENYEFKVRDKIIKQPLTYKSLSGTVIPKVILPRYKDWGDILKCPARARKSR